MLISLINCYMSPADWKTLTAPPPKIISLWDNLCFHGWLTLRGTGSRMDGQLDGHGKPKWKKVRRSERSDGRWEDPLSSPRRELGIRRWMAITSLHVGLSATVIKDGASDTMIVQEEEVRDNNPWENMNHNDRLCREDASGCIPFQRGGTE